MAQERDEGSKNPRNWCDRNLVIKEPSQSRLYFLWELVFMSAFLIEIVLVPYTACRQNMDDEEIIDMQIILSDYTKELEQVIDVIWIMNITLSFLTPFEVDISYNDKFQDIAKNYIWPAFILDVLSTLYLFVNYSTEYQWMYYLKFLRFYYFPRALNILRNAIEPIVLRCNISKQARSNIQSLSSQFIILYIIMHVIACGWILVGEHKEWGTWLTNFDIPNTHG